MLSHVLKKKKAKNLYLKFKLSLPFTTVEATQKLCFQKVLTITKAPTSERRK